MDDQSQNPEVPRPQNPIPQAPPPSPTTGLGQSSRKIIQPSEEMLKEVASNPGSYYGIAAAHGAPLTQNPQPVHSTTPPPPTTATPHSPSSVYPDANDTHLTPGGAADDKKDTSESLNFNNGYSIGGTIFWLQLLLGIVLGLLFWGITSSLLTTVSFSRLAEISLVYYLFEFILVMYVPYSTLKSSNIEEPIWITLLGIATQSVIVLSLLEIIDIVIIHIILNRSASTTLFNILHSIGGTGVVTVLIATYVGFFIAAYFITKLSWGIAFSLFGKSSSKAVIKAAGVSVVAIIVAVLVSHYLTLHRQTIGPSQSKIMYVNRN